MAKLMVQADDEIELGHGRRAEAGTAIAFRAESGTPWSGTVDELHAIVNADQSAKVLVLDTWLLNCDRYPPDPTVRRPNHNNVFLSSEGAPPGKFLLTAMDHTHCFSCGRELGSRLSRIDNVKDPRVYGRFPEFEAFLDPELVQSAVAVLGGLSRSDVEDRVAEIADDWQVSDAGRTALTDLIYDRADYVAHTIVQALFP